MTHVREVELSALLDGELDAARADEVRAMIASNLGLRAQYDALERLDLQLSGAAEKRSFMPDIEFPVVAGQATGWSFPAAIRGVLLLVAVRLGSKLAEQPLFGVGVQIVVCAIIVFLVVRMVGRTAASSGKEAGAWCASS